MRQLILLAIFSLLISCNNSTEKNFKEVNSAEMTNLMASPNTLSIDVRTPEEVSEGYIKGTNLFIDFNGLGFKGEVAKLDKEKTYIVYCRSGNRSTKALHIMNELGFKNLYELEGGISGVHSSELITR